MKIKVINKIDQEGLRLLDNHYHTGPKVEDPDGIIVRSSKVDTSQYPSLLAVARAGAGVNNITVDKATEQGICVFNTPGANSNAVAELVFVMLGISARNIHLSHEFCLGLTSLDDKAIANKVEQQKAQFRGFELAGKTIGVVGLGQIGVRVANGGASRQMHVIGFDPYPAMANIHELSSKVKLARSIQDLQNNADIISIHVPLNDKTTGMVNDGFIKRLKPGTVLINYARSPLVEHDAILRALDHGQLSHYLTDFPTKAILNHPQIICTPHLGASTEESEEQCATMAVTTLKNYLEYGTISRSVNFPTAESILKDNVACRLIMINRDIPGMIGYVSKIIGDHNINIASYINESNGKIGYNIIDLEKNPPRKLLTAIANNNDVIRTRTIIFTKD